RYGSWLGPKIPGAAALASLPQLQAVLGPSRIGSPRLADVDWPRGGVQAVASAVGKCGGGAMSACRARPCRAPPDVVTQGMPWYFCRIDSTCWVDAARSMPNQVLTARARLPAFTSAKANACEVPQGRSMPSRLLNIGP